MIFPMLAFIVILTSAVLAIMGISAPDASIFAVFFGGGTPLEMFKGVFIALWNSVSVYGDLFGALALLIPSGAIVAGFIYNRDEPIYGGLGVLIFQMLGLYTVLSASIIPVGLDILVKTVIGLFNAVFIISFINWIRGKGE